MERGLTIVARTRTFTRRAERGPGSWVHEARRPRDRATARSRRGAAAAAASLVQSYILQCSDALQFELRPISPTTCRHVYNRANGRRRTETRRVCTPHRPERALLVGLTRPSTRCCTCVSQSARCVARPKLMLSAGRGLVQWLVAGAKQQSCLCARVCVRVCVGLLVCGPRLSPGECLGPCVSAAKSTRAMGSIERWGGWKVSRGAEGVSAPVRGVWCVCVQ